VSHLLRRAASFVYKLTHSPDKRLSKLKKTMKSRVSQFDDMYARGIEELEQIEQSPGEKKL
jgi:hypothetical protein